MRAPPLRNLQLTTLTFSICDATFPEGTEIMPLRNYLFSNFGFARGCQNPIDFANAKNFNFKLTQPGSAPMASQQVPSPSLTPSASAPAQAISISTMQWRPSWPGSSGPRAVLTLEWMELHHHLLQNFIRPPEI